MKSIFPNKPYMLLALFFIFLLFVGCGGDVPSNAIARAKLKSEIPENVLLDTLEDMR